MKSTFTLMIAFLMLFLAACKNDKPPVTNSSSTVTAPTPNAASPNPSLAINHYICPNNCEGSGGAQAGNCPVCGTAYQHNDAFHNQAVQQNTQQPVTQPATQPATLPAQNSSGVYHYICSNGCAGGSSAAGNCATCGNALAHNQAYHQ